MYEVADPARAINGVANYQQALYLALQNALRDLVSELSINALKARAQLSQQLLSTAAGQLLPMGLRLISVDIKDLMLPGELKKLYSQIMQARQDSLAQLERVRGESAALRNLANAAQLANNNPSLLQLRWLQALENSSGNTVSVNLLPGSDSKESKSR